jgi:hypothetical protein
MESEIRALIVPLSEKLIKQLTEFLSQRENRRRDLFGIELLVTKVLAELALELMSGLVKLLWGRGYEGATMECAGCGAKMKFQCYLRRRLVSCVGTLTYERAYYYCRTCHLSHIPLDQRLGVGEREVSPRLERIISFLSAHLSFGIVEKALAECFEMEVNAETLREVAEEIGEEARQWEEEQRRTLEATAFDAPAGRVTPRRSVKRWVLECDGKQVGFQDGSWQEVKVGVIYEVGDRVETREGRHELIKREILARRCGWEEFAAHFWAALQRVGVREGDRLVAVADGAHSMEQIFAFVAPEAQRVRDFYHVAERIHAIGELRFGAESKEAKRWIGAQLHKLKESETSAVIRSLAHLRLSSQEAEQTRREVLGYFERHRAAMDYAAYRAEGWPIGSGAVEGGCRLIGARTNGCGRRWSEAGCDRIVALRVAVLNERLDVLRPRPQITLGLAA